MAAAVEPSAEYVLPRRPQRGDQRAASVGSLLGRAVRIPLGDAGEGERTEPNSGPDWSVALFAES
jgi:hypothetical protein